ncbi:hypothetical protein LCGC14_2912540 [marine sediment metagenome]|uniref:RNase H type-1 domain-containing protein n=1 Tax=marine sediment metagenome TaxID=412755 RepID=A0A0F8XR85_9ZZZZ
MAKLFVDANPSFVAFVLEDGPSGYQHLPLGHSSMEAEYLAVMYGLGEYFIMWQKELDARHDDLDVEKSRAIGEETFATVATPSERTRRPLPPAVLVCSDNEVVVKQLSRQWHIGNNRLRKLAQQVWTMSQNVEVKFEWVSRKKNPAGKMLP